MKSNWILRMIVLTLCEKFFATLTFASVNFVIPVGPRWFGYVLMSIPGLLMIDLLYGRTVLYSVVGGICHLSRTPRPLLEAATYFFSLIFSFGLAIAFTGQAEVLLFTGAHPWSCVAFYLTVASLVLATILYLVIKRGMRDDSSG